MDVPMRLREVLSSKHVTQSEIADALNVAPSYINAIINRKKKLPIDTLSEICGYLGISLAEFFRPFSQNEHTIPLYLQEFVLLCSDLEPADVDFLSTSVRYIKALKQAAFPTIAAAEPARKVALEKSAEIYSVLGEAAAGTPIFSESFPDEWVNLPAKYADPDRYRIIRARGDSMEPKIHTGDTVITEIGVMPYDGQMALVLLAGLADDEYTIKRVYHRDGQIILRSYNTAYSDMVYDPAEIRLCEVVTEVVKVGGAD